MMARPEPGDSAAAGGGAAILFPSGGQPALHVNLEQRNAVERSCLGLRSDWPVLTRPRLAGFQVSTEALDDAESGKAAITMTSTSMPGRQNSVVRQVRTGAFAGSTHWFQTAL